MENLDFNSIANLLRSNSISPEKAKDLFDLLKKKTDKSECNSDTDTGARPSSQIAVVGMSGQFPDAENIHVFWQNLVRGHDAIRELPLDYIQSLNSNGKPSDKKNYAWGGVLSDRDCFDPLFFNISPKEAYSMNPHQRLVLQESWKALEDAGYNPVLQATKNVGIFIGAEPTGYLHESFTGYSDAIIASRLSYFLDLKGPAIVMNTGCSSSAVAIHMACNSLRNGESTMALAGGVFAALDQNILPRLSEIGMLSPTGRCHAFNESADGTVLSEGVGIVVLKRLEDAIAEDDTIYGVIVASGINQDGTSNGITAPSGTAQEDLISDVYRKHQINPEDITYIEAHGTGTILGDSVEANALIRSFKQFTSKPNYCYLGSAKSSIGHTAAAAGVIGLIKILLSIRYKIIPGLLHFNKLNSTIEFQDSAFQITKNATEWESSNNKPLTAALNSFGHSGTNVHMVIREYNSAKLVPTVSDPQRVLIPLSARNAENLNTYVDHLLKYLNEDSNANDHKTNLNEARKSLEERMIEKLSSIIKIQKQDIEPGGLFEEYGVDANQKIQLIKYVQDEINSGIHSGEIITCESIHAMIDTMLKNHGDEWPSQLESLVGKKRTHSTLATIKNNDLNEIAYTLQTGRVAMQERVIFLASNRTELIETLTNFIKNIPDPNRYWHSRLDKNRELIEALTDDLDIQSTFTKWFLQNKLEKLARLWSQGIDINWDQMYSHKPARISLPTYPFSKERYWKPDNMLNPSQTTLLGSDKIHPLLHRNVSDFSEQKFSSLFNGEEFFFAHHSVKGKRVMPGVATLEWVRIALEQSLGSSLQIESTLCLNNIGWIRPIVMGSDPREIFLKLAPQHEAIAYSIYSLDNKNEIQIHTQGYANTKVLAPVDRCDVEELKSTCKLHYNAEQFYAAFKSAGVNLGTALQGIKNVHVGSNEVLAELSLPVMLTSTKDEFFLHPSLLDSAVQAFIGLVIGPDFINPAIPFALDELIIRKKFTPTMFAHVRSTGGNLANDKMMKLDIDVCDQDGEVCAQMKGMAVRLLENEIETNYEHPQAVLFIPELIEVSAEQKIYHTYHTHHLFLPDVSEDILFYLRDNLSDAHLHSFVPSSENEANRFCDYASLLFSTVKAILYKKPKNSILVQVLTPSTPDWQNLSSVRAFLQTAAIENPFVHYQVIEVEKGFSAKSIFDILQKSKASVPNQKLVYKQQKLYIEGWKKQNSEKIEMPWKDNGTYLITGGAGGLGKIVAYEIAQKVKKATLILTGRSKLDAEKQKLLSELKKSGTDAHYISCEIGNRQAVIDLINSIQSDIGPINGIIHSAGVNRDNYILKKTEEEFREVLSPKVNGLVYLDEASKSSALDFFITFSSTAGAFGNAGQADYATANSFMDHFMVHRESRVQRGEREGRSISINWPLWQHGGMSVDEETLKSIYLNTGMKPMPTEQGVDALYRSWALPSVRCMVIAGTTTKIERFVDTLNHSQTTPNNNIAGNIISPENGIQSETHNVPTGSELEKDALNFFKQIVSSAIQLPAPSIDVDAPFQKYGIDSIMVIQLNGQLEQQFGPLSKTLFFEYRNIRELTQHFITSYSDALRKLITPASKSAPATAQNQPSEINSHHNATKITFEHTRLNLAPAEIITKTTPENKITEIAIVGLAGKFPGARNIEEFWKNLSSEKDSISEVPKDRWDINRYFDSRKNTPGKVYSKWGGFIDDVDKFDPLFFNISPRDAALLDPQERLFLECAYHTLEDAGVLNKLKHVSELRNMGVFVGVMFNEYQLLGVGRAEDTTNESVWGISSSIANRVSYFFDLNGPSMTVDTMCSSSLTSIHLACESIKRGECTAALAGGVNVSVHPNKYLFLSNNKFASSKGKCESFGLGGDGYVPGEGVGAVLLKPRNLAERDGDIIYGLIKSSAINHGGKTNGYTIPNPNAHAKVISKAIQHANINPRAISYIEAHGTGTSLGDPIEIEGLKKAFEQFTHEKQFCSIGSAKSNIGHCESAAGIAGIAKVLLQFKYKKLVPSLHSKILNPYIDFSDSPFTVQQSLEDWKRPVFTINGKEQEHSRVAGVSSFGAGGSNAHIILEEYAMPVNNPTLVSKKKSVVIILSAKTKERLRAQAEQLLKTIQESKFTDDDLSNIAYTLQVYREHMEDRLGFITSSLSDLKVNLSQFLQSEKINAFYLDDNYSTVSLNASNNSSDHKSILHQWLNGSNIDWNQIYSESKLKKINLPGHLFLKERYWVESPNKSLSDSRRRDVIHPLLHENTSVLSEQRFTTTFSGNEFFVAGHVVNNTPVIAGVAFLEMARAAITKSSDTKDENACLVFQHHNWYRPIIVKDNPISLTIGLSAEKDGKISYSIYNRDHPAWICSQGSAIWRFEPPFADYDIDYLKSICSDHILSQETCYPIFEKMGVRYGASQQALKHIQTGNGTVLAKITIPDSVKETIFDYTIHPSLLDAVIQATIFINPDNHNFNSTSLKPYIPVSIDEAILYADCSTTLWAFIQQQKSDHTDILRTDIDIINEKGVICIRITGLRSRVPENARTKDPVTQSLYDTKELSGLVTLLPSWNVIQSKIRSGINFSKKTVIIGARDSHDKKIEEFLVNGVKLNFTTDEEINPLKKKIIDLGPFEQIVWIVSNPSFDITNSTSIIDSQKEGVLKLFHFIKTLLQLNYDAKNLVWTFVTEQVQPLNESENNNPAHSGLFGFIGSMAKEFPSWKTRLVDVAINEPWPSWSALLSMPFTEGQPYVHRNKQWYECQFIPVELPQKHEQPSVYRQGGTYVVIGGTGGIGREWSEYLVKKYNAQLIWIGRRKVDTEINNKLDAIGNLGKRPLYFSADASSMPSLQQTYREIKEVCLAINGIVHAALVLHGRNLVSMELDPFKQTLASKIDTSVIVSTVFSKENSDFILFFSSTNSLIKAAGQSNYAAGSTFQDIYAHWLSLQLSCNIKVINWGYWANIGRVANADGFNTWLKRKGIESIEPKEGMQLLENFLVSPFRQMAVFKVANHSGLEGIVPANELITLSQDDARLSLTPLQSVFTKVENDSMVPSATMQELNSLNAVLMTMLKAQLIKANLCTEKQNQQKRFDRWIHESFRILDQQELPKKDNIVENAWEAWEQQKSRWLNNSDLRAHVTLVEATLKALPDILLGRRLATDIIFPQSTMRLTEGIYKNNAIANYFNIQVANTITALVQQRIKKDPSTKIKIIEFGAGTGGTSAGVFEMLKPYSQHIEIYSYTDVSKAFLLHAEDNYKPLYPYVNTVLFDLQKPAHLQGLELKSYDIAIAANVVHATKNVSNTLRNLKATLKRNGILILNEISRNSLFNHLTFGLLDGWWLYEDGPVRIPGCPGLTAQSWKLILEQEGFYTIPSLSDKENELDQQIIIAQSNGAVRQSKTELNFDDSVIRFRNGKENTFSALVNGHESQSSDSSEEYVKETIIKALEETLKISRKHIDTEKQFADYGLDSILGVNFVQSINEKLGIDFDTTRLFDYVTVTKLTNYLFNTYASRIHVPRAAITPNQSIVVNKTSDENSALHKTQQHTQLKTNSNVSVESIAIIGMSGRFAECESLDELWTNLSEGKDLIKKVSRWNLAEYFDKETPEQEYCNQGSFVKDIDCFDPLFFSISGSEATYMDPQQRLFLEESWRALEDAGYAGKAVEGKRCGVYVGHNNTDYSQLFREHTNIPAQAMWGNAASIIPARIAYYLNLQGPAITIDSACSSSLVAIHLACQGLWSGETEMALAGGVFIQCTPEFYITANRSGMLSPTGRCYTFDDRANGFVPGEGVGAVILKRLTDALRDGDHIYGVIAGSGLNQDGTTNGITAPSANSQEALEKYVYEKFKINPENIQMAEAHGTGTKLGDPIEFNALTRSFRHFTSKKNYCAIGSIKSNLGHATAAAGMAGLFKIMLSLKNEQILPSLHFQNGNKNINFNDSPFYVNSALTTWKAVANQKRCAVISAFGFSGTNAHLVIEEAPAVEYIHSAKPAYLIVLSARTKSQLKIIANDILAFCEKKPVADCGDISFTLLTGRKHNKHRLACLASNTADLASQLLSWCHNSTPDESSEFWYSEINAAQENTARQPVVEKIARKFTSSPSTKEYIYRLIEMANLFTTSNEIDFSSFFAGEHFKRISLPVYPFAKERYWVSPPAGNNLQVSKKLYQPKVDHVETFSFAPFNIPEPTINFTVDGTFDLNKEKDSDFESFTLVPVWRNQIIVHNNHYSSTASNVLIVGGTTWQLKMLRELYPAAAVLDIQSNDSQEMLARKIYTRLVIEHMIYIAHDSSRQKTTDDALIEKQKNTTLHLFRLTKALVELGYESKDLLCTIITTAGRNIHKSENVNLLHAAIHGFTGSLAKEFPYWKVRLVDLPSDQDWPVHQILSMPSDIHGNAKVYRNQKWYSQKLVETKLPLAHESFIKKNGVYVIIGGAGGVGEVFSEYLIKTYQARIIWIGRRQKDDSVERKIERIAKFGSAPVYISADATDKVQLQQAYVKISQQFGKVNGLLHAAMVLLDQSIINLTEDKFYAGLANKADICVRMAQVFKDETLDFVLFFSSMISFTTAAGQSNYASGSLYKDAFAHQLSKEWSCPVKVINWGYWGEVGIVASEEYRTSMLNKGIGSIQPAEAMEIIESLLPSKVDQVAFIRAKRPLPLHIIEPEQQHDEEEKADLIEILQDLHIPLSDEGLPADNIFISENIIHELVQFVASQLNVSQENIEVHAEWSELGFDPVTLNKLMLYVNERYEMELTTEILIKNHSVNGISIHIADVIKRRIVTSVTTFDLLFPIENATSTKQPEVPFYMEDVRFNGSTINNN